MYFSNFIWPFLSHPLCCVSLPTHSSSTEKRNYYFQCIHRVYWFDLISCASFNWSLTKISLSQNKKGNRKLLARKGKTWPRVLSFDWDVCKSLTSAFLSPLLSYHFIYLLTFPPKSTLDIPQFYTPLKPDPICLSLNLSRWLFFLLFWTVLGSELCLPPLIRHVYVHPHFKSLVSLEGWSSSCSLLIPAPVISSLFSCCSFLISISFYLLWTCSDQLNCTNKTCPSILLPLLLFFLLLPLHCLAIWQRSLSLLSAPLQISFFFF